MTGRGWKGAAASLVIHGSLFAGALALSGFAHDGETAIVIDFSLLPTRDLPGESPASAAVPSAEAERRLASAAVTEKPPVAAKSPLPVKKPTPPPIKPPPLLQEGTETAAPVPVPVPVPVPAEPAKEIVEELSEEREVSAPPVNTSDTTPLSNSERAADAAKTLPENHRTAPSGAASGEGRSSHAGSGDGGDSLSAGLSGPAGAGEDSTGGNPASQRDFSFIREKVQRNTRYPRLARQMGLEGQVKISFTVCHDGEVIDIKVMESSGASILDRCAIEAVKKTSPFPSQQLEAKVIIPIVYRLKE